MRIYLRREPPETWQQRRATVKRPWAVPFVYIEYGTEWLAYFLNNWTFLEVLEYLSSFGVLIAVIFYFAESGDRLKQKHYQAWQVINSAEGKGGNGGRIEALEELNADGVRLVGVNLSSAFLQGIRLKKANLVRANFDDADAREAQLESARIDDASLQSTNLRGANLKESSFERSDLDNADLTGANLQGADLTVANLQNADLHNANLQGVKWETLQSIKGANLYGVKNPPPGFLEWATSHGAISKPEE
jgi:Pentapeptide repeats (8 copies)